LVAVARSDQPSKKELFMSTTTNAPAQPAATQPAATGATTNPAQAAAPVTQRSDAAPNAEDLTKIVTEAATAAATAAVTAALQRSEPAGATTNNPAATPPAEEEKKYITREDLASAVEAAIKPLAEQVATIAGKTVVRNDMPDATVKDGGNNANAQRKDVFKGALGLLSSSKK
jgi:hypothetical protein